MKDTRLMDQLKDKAKTIDEKIEMLTATIKSVAISCRAPRQNDRNKLKDNKQITSMINLRRAAGKTDPALRKALSKDIQKEIKKEMKRLRKHEIASRLRQFVGLKRIADLKGNGKRKVMASMISAQGERRTDRHAIADTFATFYEDLFRSRCAETREQLIPDPQPLEQFTTKEVHAALKNMKRGKAGDKSGLVAELLKDGGNGVNAAIALLFNDILDSASPPPEVWKESRISVIFKQGDEQRPENYRPITLLPILYKLFSRMLHARIKSVLEEAQPVDQAGF